MIRFFNKEVALLFGLIAVITFKSGADSIFHYQLNSIPGFILSVGLLTIMMACIFSVVRHSDALAIKLGDPYGTLILTLSVISLEVVMISSVMLTGDNNPVLARDTMFAVIMMVLNGLVGISLLIGGLKHHTQTYNINGIKSYLVAMIPIAILSLVLPNFTLTRPDGSMSIGLSFVLVVASIALYSVFLFIQTRSHTHFFVDADLSDNHDFDGPIESNLFHTLMLIAYLAIVILLAKSIAIPIDNTVTILGAPPALSGLIVAAMILAPEAVGGVKAVLKNQLQRVLNLFLGSVLATISLTVPAVLLISHFIQQPIILGLETVETILLITTLVMAGISFSSGRTNALTGAAHLILFVAYLVLMFE